MKTSLSALERRSILTLACIYGLRMYGLFLLLPVFAIYAEDLQGATPVLMGIALGIYGIAQAVLQIPFGALSDRYGRKPLIVVGLGLFAIGSLVAAFSNTIEGVIVGRALQGSGAIAAVILALASDLTRENQRTKAMAFIGVSIGLSFVIALMSAPILSYWIGVKGLFVLTAVFAIGSIALVVKALPTPVRVNNLEVRAVPVQMLNLLRNTQLLRLDFGIFILHFILMALFIAVPMVLLQDYQLASQNHWQVYLPSLLLSLLFVMPLIIWLSSHQKSVQSVFFGAICLLVLALMLLMWRPPELSGAIVCLFFFFWGFNLLEAMLPSLVSRIAPAGNRGSAIGVFNTFQFTGVFFGGWCGGLLYGRYGVEAVFALCGALLLLWMALVHTSPHFELGESRIVKFANYCPISMKKELLAIPGVKEVSVIEDQGVAYLKVDKAILDNDALNQFLGQLD